MDALKIRSLSHSYNGDPALSDVSFTVGDRDLFCVLGPNGSGKSTLFRCLSTLLQPSSGNILISDRIDLVKDPARARRLIGTVFQHAALDEKLTVRENLLVAAALYGIGKKRALARISELSRMLDIEDRLDDRVGRLSGGLRRRADLLRGILHDPAIILLDEPTTGLDPAARRKFWTVIHQIRTDKSATILYTSHLMEEADAADRLMILSHGRIVASGTADGLRRQTGGERLLLKARRQNEIVPWLQSTFDARVEISAGFLYIATERPAEIMLGLQDTWPDAILELTIRKPSLEDIFFESTGHRWDAAQHSSETEEGEE